MSLKWNTEKRKLSDLIPVSYNPRRLTEKQHEDLRNSLNKFGLAEIPAINTDNTILAGHQRISILSELENPDFQIEVRVPERHLTEKEAEEYNIRSNKNTGEWDFDKLANFFDTDDLIEWGFDEIELGLNSDESLDDDEDTQTLSLKFTKDEYYKIVNRMEALLKQNDLEEREDLFIDMLENYESVYLQKDKNI